MDADHVSGASPYRHIRAYASRDRTRVQRLKNTHGAELVRDGGPAAAFRATWALYVHMTNVRPGWPDEEQRAEDLQHHVHLRQLMDRISRAIADS